MAVTITAESNHNAVHLDDLSLLTGGSVPDGKRLFLNSFSSSPFQPFCLLPWRGGIDTKKRRGVEQEGVVQPSVEQAISFAAPRSRCERGSVRPCLSTPSMPVQRPCWTGAV